MRQALLFLSPSRDKQRHRASEARKSGARFEMQAIWAQNPLLFIDWLLLSLKRSWTTTGEEGRENPSTWLEQTAYSLGLLSNQKEESSAHLCVLSHVWLCNLKHCGPPGSSIHGMFQARVLEWMPLPSPLSDYQSTTISAVSASGCREHHQICLKKSSNPWPPCLPQHP